MEKNQEFYGVYGNNGCGVYDSYYQALPSNAYLKEFRIKKFDTFQDAEEFALDGFAEYVFAETPFPDCDFPEKLPLNRTLYPMKKPKK